jgi:hypothetical protein
MWLGTRRACSLVPDRSVPSIVDDFADGRTPPFNKASLLSEGGAEALSQ